MNLTNDKIIHINGENLDYIQFRKLLKYKELTHAYTLKNNHINYGPNITMQEYLNNYYYLCQELNLDVNSIIKPDQKHTSNVKIITEKVIDTPLINTKDLNEVDGLITNKRNITLATTNADCILFLLYDPINKVIANIHSGWRGSLNKIIINTLITMHNTYKSNYKDIICCICPSIRKCHFEVDKDVKDLFYNKFKYLSNINTIITKEKNKYHIDTILLNITLMLELGIEEDNIIDSGICSVCYAKYINSYRVDKDNYKRSTAIISLK